jgi:hypothetical protein
MPSRSDGPFSIDWKRIVNWSVRIFVLVSVVVILVFAALRSRHGVRGPDYCPIDGKQAQWTKRRTETLCEYGHYSNAERTAHTWSGACP